MVPAQGTMIGVRLSRISAATDSRAWAADFEEVTPFVDIYEDGDDLVVKAELPGMSKEDINVSLSDDVVTISGEKKREKKIEKKNYYRLESCAGSFRRSFKLPADVQTEKAKAKFKAGILEMRIPKTEEAKRKEIRVEIN